ncbi:LapA family protein [Nocardioides sp.]|uniref:LapA family protein n=1 Tax=Nocardioides sp. TaxID=35761 RepID=UPI003D14758F
MAHEEPLPPGDPADAEPVGPEPSAGPSEASVNPLRHSRTSGLWGAVVALGIVLILLVIFIVQNTQKVEVSFLGWNGRTPLAAALLIATAAGLIVAAIVGTLRIWQLRRRVKHHN